MDQLIDTLNQKGFELAYQVYSSKEKKAIIDHNENKKKNLIKGY